MLESLLEDTDESDLINLLKKCCDAYFNTDDFYILNDNDIILLKNNNIVIQCNDENKVTDAIYDFIYNEIQMKYPTNNFFKQVGFEERTGKVKLPFVMGSLNELKEGDLEKWKIQKPYVVSAKLDGVSCGLVYKHGKLINAYSRGNGIEGQEILRHVYDLDTIQKQIPSSKDLIYIRGELIVPKNEISIMLEEIEQETGKVLKNGRNSVSGYINSKQGNLSVKKHLKFLAYHIENFEGSEFEMFEILNKKFHFVTPFYDLKENNEINETQLTELVKHIKTNYEYECDGIILTLNQLTDEFEGYETGTNNPKRSRKYKIGALDNEKETEVKDIEWNISKDGYLKPRVKIQPVDLVGVTINYATGHNYGNIKEKEIGVGSKIIIKRAGDVIPYILKVTETSNNIPMPECCYNIEKNDKGEDVDLIFDYEKTSLYKNQNIADKFYNEMLLQKLVYFCAKLNIDYAGEGNLKILFNEYLSQNNSPLEIDKFIQLDKFIFEKEIGINGEKLYDSLHNRLNNLDECAFFDAVNCFGRGIGELKLKKIYSKYQTLCVSEEQILSSDGWAEKTCEQYINHIQNYFRWKDILNQLNISFKEQTNNELESTILCDVNVCFTGIRDANMENFIIKNGGKILSSVNKTCNLLVCKSLSDNSTKLKKAREKNIEIIDYDEACRRFY